MDTPDVGSLVFTEEKLYNVKNDIVGFDSTRDGKFLFWFERSPDGRVIPVGNGTAASSFDAFWDPLGRRLRRRLPEWVVESDYLFSEDGCHFAYVGRRRTGIFAAIDGVQSREYEAMGERPSFDPTGSTSVYTARVDGVTRLVLNGEVQLEYEAVPGGTAFSPDGSRIAFVARVPGGEAVVLDGKAGSRSESTGTRSRTHQGGVAVPCRRCRPPTVAAPDRRSADRMGPRRSTRS